MPSPALQKEALCRSKVFTNCIIFHHRLYNATSGFERSYVFRCHFWAWIAWSWRQNGSSSTERHHMIQYYHNISSCFFPNMISIAMHIACPSLVSFIILLNKNTRLYLQHLYIQCTYRVWQYNVLQCYALLIFFPMSIRWWATFCVCTTPTSPENGHHFFEVIVLTNKLTNKTESSWQR